MRFALLALVFILIAGCTAPAASPPTATAKATPSATPTPLPSLVPSATPSLAPTPSATPTPTPAKTTYIALTDRICSPTNVMLELENSGMYNSGKPLMRVYQIEGGQQTKTCLEFTLPFEVLKGESKTQYNFQNSKYGVEECDYSAGDYRLEVVEPGTSGVWFKAIDFSCP